MATSIIETLPRHLLELLMFIGVFVLISLTPLYLIIEYFNNFRVYAAAAYKLLPGINQLLLIYNK